MVLDALCNNGIGHDVDNLGFPKIRGTILGVPIIRIVVYWGLCCLKLPLEHWV